jgi:hypothetical protein
MTNLCVGRQTCHDYGTIHQDPKKRQKKKGKMIESTFFGTRKEIDKPTMVPTAARKAD